MTTLAQIRKERAERHLKEYIQQAWHTVEPPTNPYTPGWHLDAICEHLEAVTNGEIRKLIINIPPRHMKSLAVSVFWPTWVWIKAPGLRFLFASYAATLSIRDSVRSRRVIDSPWYQANWGDRFSFASDQNTKMRYENNKGGYRIATSVDGVATGEGGDIIGVDDPHNVNNVESDTMRIGALTWWDEVMSTRLNDPRTGARVMIMQRSHEGDLTGHVLAKEHDWEHLCLPARYEPDHPTVWGGDPRTVPGQLLWEERFGETEIKGLEVALGSYAAAGQLQQRPAPRSGGMFNRAHFKIIDRVPDGLRWIRYWDLAATEDKQGLDPDYTAGCKFAAYGDGRFVIADMQRFREQPLGVETRIKQTAALDGRHTTIFLTQEGGASGKSLIDHYRRTVLRGFAMFADRETGSKALRAEPLSAAVEGGNVDLVAGEWVTPFLDEIAVFPVGKHDDQVDAASGAHRMITSIVQRKMVRVRGT